MLTKLTHEKLDVGLYRSSMPFHKYYDSGGNAYAEMKSQKVSVIVMLVSDAEALEKSGMELREMYLEDGLAVVHLPIQDYDIPERAALDEAVAQTVQLMRAGKSVAVHCSAGIGRTGLFLAELGKQLLEMEGEEAIAWVRSFVPGAVETSQQADFVTNG